jgi:hypothetical protein
MDYVDNMIVFTPELVRALQVAYDKARDAGTESFMFEGHELLVGYAKYLLEYLRTQFPGA